MLTCVSTPGRWQQLGSMQLLMHCHQCTQDAIATLCAPEQDANGIVWQTLLLVDAWCIRLMWIIYASC